jgi:hypothetical protein
MRRPATLCVAFAGLLALVLGIGTPTPTVQAQRARAGEGIELPTDLSTEELTKGYKAVTEVVQNLLNGKVQPEDSHAKAIDMAAQWFAFRLTWRTIQQADPKKNTGTLRAVHLEFDRLMNTAEKTKNNNKKALARFTAQMMKRLGEVLAKGNLQARVHAAMMAQRLCQTGRPELIGFLVKMLQGKDEVVKIFAIKGLREVFRQQPAPPEDPKDRNAHNTTVYGAALEALLKYISPKLDIPEKASEADKEFLYRTPRYFRREAIRALAQIRQPALVIDKGGKVEGPIAYHLLRILAARDVVPPPILSEQVEAAIGVCRLPSQPEDAYQPDLALALVGRFIAGELVEQYNRDWERTGDTTLTRNKEKKIAAEPWKTHAARLAQALTDMKTATKGDKVKLVADIAGKAQDILKVMEGRRKKVGDELPRLLTKALAELKPAEEVYKGNTDYTIKLASEE